MKTRKVVIIITMTLLVITITGCKKAVYVPKPFPVNGSTYYVHEDALDTMRDFEAAQQGAAKVNERPVSEWEHMGIYGKAAGKKGKTKITPKSAKKALREYRKMQEILAASLPPIVPDIRGYNK